MPRKIPNFRVPEEEELPRSSVKGPYSKDLYSSVEDEIASLQKYYQQTDSKEEFESKRQDKMKKMIGKKLDSTKRKSDEKLKKKEDKTYSKQEVLMRSEAIKIKKSSGTGKSRSSVERLSVSPDEKTLIDSNDRIKKKDKVYYEAEVLATEEIRIKKGHRNKHKVDERKEDSNLRSSEDAVTAEFDYDEILSRRKYSKSKAVVDEKGNRYFKEQEETVEEKVGEEETDKFLSVEDSSNTIDELLKQVRESMTQMETTAKSTGEPKYKNGIVRPKKQAVEQNKSSSNESLHYLGNDLGRKCNDKKFAEELITVKELRIKTNSPKQQEEFEKKERNTESEKLGKTHTVDQLLEMLEKEPDIPDDFIGGCENIEASALKQWDLEDEDDFELRKYLKKNCPSVVKNKSRGSTDEESDEAEEEEEDALEEELSDSKEHTDNKLSKVEREQIIDPSSSSEEDEEGGPRENVTCQKHTNVTVNQQVNKIDINDVSEKTVLKLKEIGRKESARSASQAKEPESNRKEYSHSLERKSNSKRTNTEETQGRPGRPFRLTLPSSLPKQVGEDGTVKLVKKTTQPFVPSKVWGARDAPKHPIIRASNYNRVMGGDGQKREPMKAAHEAYEGVQESFERPSRKFLYEEEHLNDVVKFITGKTRRSSNTRMKGKQSGKGTSKDRHGIGDNVWAPVGDQ